MTTTKKSLRPASGLASAIATALILTSCASPSARSDLEYGRALMATGSIKDAYVVLQNAQAQHPQDAEIAAALASARERLATFFLSEGNTAMAQSRWDDAVANFSQLTQMKGYEAQGKERLVAVDLARRQEASGAAPVIAPVAALPAGQAVAVPAITASASAPLPTTAPAPTPAPAPVAVPAPKTKAVSVAVLENAKVMSVESAPVAAPTPPTSAPASAPVAVAPVSSLQEALSRKVTLQFRDATVRSLFDAIGKTSGLNIVIDKDVAPDLKTSIYLKDTSIRNALEKIVLTTHLGWSATDDNTLLIYPDEQPKQSDYQNLVVRGFHLANADVKMVANSLKTVLKFRDVMVDEKLNMIVVRDTPQALALAEQLIALHDVPEPEVMLEVAIIEVSKGKLQSLGVAWPPSITLSPIARSAQPTVTTSTTDTLATNSATTAQTIPLTLKDLYNLTPGSLGLTMGGLTVNANATDSDVNILANPRIRAKNREKAKILIGERVPNISATATSNGVVSQNITYVDVGLKLDVEPQIYPGNEIGLKIALEVSSINSTITNTANGTVAYRIGTRNASTVLRLKDGENQILAGLIQNADRTTATKVPLLGDIPILGRLFRSDDLDKSKTEIVLSITPHLIRGIAKPTADGESFDAGTVTSVRGHRTESETPQQQDQPAAAQPTQVPAPQPSDAPGVLRRSND
jgi:general secretion pathway protein D